MVHHIRRADLTLDGADKKQKRTSAMTTADQLKVDKREAILLSRKLLSLQRTLKVLISNGEIFKFDESKGIVLGLVNL